MKCWRTGLIPTRQATFSPSSASTPPFERSSMVKRAGSSSLRACPVDFCPSAKLAFTESTRISGYLAERTVLLTPPIRRGPELATFGLQEVRKQEIGDKTQGEPKQRAYWRLSSSASSISRSCPIAVEEISSSVRLGGILLLLGTLRSRWPPDPDTRASSSSSKAFS